MKLMLLVARNTTDERGTQAHGFCEFLGGNAWSTVDVVGLYREVTLQ